MLNPLLLGLSQFLLMVYLSVGLAFTGLVGKELASASYATIPYLFATIATMMVAIVLDKITLKLGYKKLFIMGGVAGVFGALLSGYAIEIKSFVLFCIGAMLTGVFQASASYYRFAASDSVVAHKKSTAIGWVLSGGVLAAFVGPLFARYAVGVGNTVYAGAFYSVSVVAICILPLVAYLQPVNESYSNQLSGVRAYGLKLLFKNTLAVRAMTLCAGSYGVMVFMMLASPLAVKGCGLHLDDATSVIQWHLVGMFAPSLIVGKFIAKVGEQRVSWIGIGVLFIGCLLALSGNKLIIFQVALFCVGLGWNFMFMAGSTLIAQVENAAMKAKLQSTNEFLSFACMGVCSGLSGVVFNVGGWQMVATIGCGMLLCLVALLIVFRKNHQN